MITESVAAHSRILAQDSRFPAYIYDLDALAEHAGGIRSSLSSPGAPEIFYAAKANPDPAFLRTVAPFVHGFEVASGGELEHVLAAVPGVRIAFGGPGKTDAELRTALELRVERFHVESPHELKRLADLSRSIGGADILLRVNLAGDRSGVALAMTGPFGMDPDLIEACHGILASAPWIRLRGIHAHLASGLDAAAMLRQGEEILAWARPWLAAAGVAEPEINLGGGMAVDYSAPDSRFDWQAYGEGVAKLARTGETLRIEPGRAVAVYAGWYVTDVLDVKRAHGEWYAVLRGGTMQIRTPVTKGHDHPFTILPNSNEGQPSVENQPVTFVGQLCTPKDVFARSVPVERIGVGDVVAFSMSGAYAWNISHHDFLMHPKPGFHYLSTASAR
ncbi:type III PLP-dependent enzyme [Streptomyces lunaelactis]|uniref:type III PLP-dependent enzyme n=1 Tax=Streptomyces lunaelactis TaxID=1535768 RepID=UPI001584886F|nr:type III PLP-dependent enzyme [Streptomyces lunaelactis]NUK11167.1 type III PLP-dependent enzyme [Streptomyces lunaelactis]NUK74670.1 type III PLP-dependent enzyme [Streptomyces lunaelactis]NUL13221.1 type III PLP-dependent enzyme [Streptomyces lunaelactis]NUL26235.1 type III PLP-dependent enzyme [Streptomyces lunaelactis]